MSDRVMLNVKVPKEIKEVYDFVIGKKYGFKDPYAGFELEKELRINFDMGEDSAMFDSLQSLTEKRAEKNDLRDYRYSPGDVMVQYKVHPKVRAKLKQAKKEGTATMGEIVAKVMYKYAMGHGYQDRMRDRVNELEEEANKNDDLDTEERRTRDIAEYLNENNGDGFTIEDFNEAVESVPNISASDYVREKYLKKVLDRLGASPLENGAFSIQYTGYDPRGLPPEARTPEETKTAVKTELFDKLHNLNRADVKSVLGIGPRKAKDVMRSVANTEEGFSVQDSSDGLILEVDMSKIKEYLAYHEQALKLAGLLEEDDPDDVQDPTESNSTNQAQATAD